MVIQSIFKVSELSLVGPATEIPQLRVGEFFGRLVERLVNRNWIDHFATVWKLRWFIHGLHEPRWESRKRKRKNESESYSVAAYTGIPSFLWNAPCRWIRILVGGIFSEDILFNFSNIDWEICHEVGSTHSFKVLLFAYWQSRLEIVHSVCFLS